MSLAILEARTRARHPASILPVNQGVYWGAAAIVGVTLAAYLPALAGGFIWDDDALVFGNPLIKASNGLFGLWFTGQAPDYWPATSTTFWLEWRLWGMHALGYHATNLALHVVESLLLWAVLRRLRLPGAFLAAVIFAVHPVNVESVAWIAQRKNLMAMLFFLLAVFSFLKTQPEFAPAGSRPAQPLLDSAIERTGRWYGASLLCFILGLLSKSSVATLPVVLLGIIAWNRPLNRKDLLRTVPFFAVAAVLVLVETGFQRQGLVAAVRTATFIERLLGAAMAVWFYLGKALWPTHLTFVYPQWRIEPGHVLDWLPLVAAVSVTAGLFYYRRRWSRGPLFAWAYFCVTLLPALGFVDVYFMRYSLVADHYQHLALIGVVGGVASGWAQWRALDTPKGQTRTNLLSAAAVAVVGLLVVLTWRQCETYRDSETLYRATLERNPASWLARNNLGELLHQAGHEQEAEEQFAAAVHINPNYYEAHNNLGNALRESGRIPEAIREFGEALRIDPSSAETHNNLGNILFQSGRVEEAIGQYEKALSINPAYAEAHNGLGNALLQSGKVAEAIGHYEAAVRIRPNYLNAHFDLGAALLESGRNREAAGQFRLVLQINPGDTEARRYLQQAESDPPSNSTGGHGP